MTRHSYRAMNATAFLSIAAAQASMAAGCERDAYLASDEETRMLASLLRDGFRFVGIHDGAALFERVEWSRTAKAEDVSQDDVGADLSALLLDCVASRRQNRST